MTWGERNMDNDGQESRTEAEMKAIRQKAFEADGITEETMDAGWRRLLPKLRRSRRTVHRPIVWASLFWLSSLGCFTWLAYIAQPASDVATYNRHVESTDRHFYFNFRTATLLSQPPTPLERLLKDLGMVYFIIALLLTFWMGLSFYYRRKSRIRKQIVELERLIALEERK